MGRDLDDLEYAALMHDIGQLSLSDPIPGGATTMVSPLDQRQIAELGGGIAVAIGRPFAPSAPGLWISG
mgnify:CR=1 FL=1